MAVRPQSRAGDDSDAELATRIASTGGDSDAEARLCTRFAPRVRAYGLRHLQDDSAADDLVQRVLVLTLEKLRAGEVRQPERIASFVLGSARMCARDMRRRATRSEALDLDHTTSPAAVTQPVEPIDRARLAAAVAELPERERSVLVLSFFEQASAPEIADTLGMAAGHVRVVRHRALARLRTQLAPGREGWT